MNGKVNLISQSAYARLRGVAKSAVAKAVAEGRISLIDGKVDPAVADIQWAANTRARADSRKGDASADDQAQGRPGQPAPVPVAAPAPAPAAEPTYQDARTRREIADAERAERENAKSAGLLIQRDTAERTFFDVVRQLRDAVMNAPQRAAPKVIGMADAREIERVFTDELRKAFEGWEQRALERLPARETS